MLAPARLLVPLAALVVAASVHAQTASQVRGAVDDATRAVAGDTAAPLVDRWTAALHRDSTDRLAALGLATVARVSLHYDQADQRYRALLPHPGARPDLIGAYARLGQAFVLGAQSAPGPADTAFAGAAAAAEAVGDSAALAEALIGWASVRAHSQSRASAGTILRRASRFISPSDASLLAQFQCTEVSIGALPRGADPLAVARSGAALAREANDRPSQAMCGFELGKEYLRVGDMAAAVAAFDTTEREALGNDRGGLARLRQYRAFVEEEMGDYSDALRSVRIAVANGELSRNLSVIAYAKLTQGKVYMQLGDLDAASRAADGAVAVFERTGDGIGHLSALSVRGQIALAAGDLGAARSAYEMQLAGATQLGDAGYLADAQQSLADVATRQGQWDVAEQWLRAVGATIHQYRSAGWSGGLQYAQGMLALRSGRLPEAERDVSAIYRGLGPDRH